MKIHIKDAITPETDYMQFSKYNEELIRIVSKDGSNITVIFVTVENFKKMYKDIFNDADSDYMILRD